MRRYLHLTAICLMSVILAPSPPRSEAGRKDQTRNGGDYDLVVLAPPAAEMVGSLPTDLDEFGNAVGIYLDADQNEYGFYFDLALNNYLLFDSGIVVYGLNNLGEMVGEDQDSGQGLYWSSPLDTDPVPLPPLDGDLATSAVGINDAGIIIGHSFGEGSEAKVAWLVDDESVPSAPIELPAPEGYSLGRVVDLSKQVDGITCIVGEARTTGAQPDKAVGWTVAVDEQSLYVNSGPVDFGSLGGDASALAVNSGGDVVGRSDFWPYLKFAGEPLAPLPGLRKATVGSATGINDHGQIVGQQGYLPNGPAGIDVQRAVLWPDSRTVVDLNKMVVLGSGDVLESAYRINNSGIILGRGYLPMVTEYGSLGVLLIPK